MAYYITENTNGTPPEGHEQVVRELDLIMSSYDELPQKVRVALANSPVSWDTIDAQYLVDAFGIDNAVRLIEDQNDKLVSAYD